MTANRYGFSAYGAQCAYERIYYDLEYGQLKTTYPKWDGFDGLLNNQYHLENITNNITKDKNILTKGYDYFHMDDSSIDKIWKTTLFYPIPQILAEKIMDGNDPDAVKNKVVEIENNIYSKLNTYIQLIKYTDLINEKINNIDIKKGENIISDLKEGFESYKSKFIKDFNYYTKVARAMGRILPIIYFSLLLIFVVGSGALLITYYCKKVNQQWWILPMHIAWNGLRFFIFSFFMYGCAYGMLFLGSRDAIAYLQYAFSKENLISDNPIILPENSIKMLKYCLLDDTYTFENELGNSLLDKFLFYLFKYEKIQDPKCPYINQEVENGCETVFEDLQKSYRTFYNNFRPESINFFKPMVEQTGTIYGNFNCSFVNNTIHLMYRAIWDFSWETRILCALSCCIAFFGIIAVYSFLWSMHLWKKEDNYYNSENNNNKKSKNFNFNKNKTLKKKFIPAPKDNVSENNSEFKNDDNDDDENS